MKARNFVMTAIIVSATAAVARLCLVCMFVYVCVFLITKVFV